jgi:hypothetical protein
MDKLQFDAVHTARATNGLEAISPTAVRMNLLILDS